MWIKEADETEFSAPQEEMVRIEQGRRKRNSATQEGKQEAIRVCNTGERMGDVDVQQRGEKAGEQRR